MKKWVNGGGKKFSTTDYCYKDELVVEEKIDKAEIDEENGEKKMLLKVGSGGDFD